MQTKQLHNNNKKSFLVGSVICNGCNKVHDHKICVFYRFDNTKRSCLDDGITNTNENNTNLQPIVLALILQPLGLHVKYSLHKL